MDDLDKCENTVSWRFGKEIEEPLKEVKDEGSNHNIDLRRAVLHHAERDILFTI